MYMPSLFKNDLFYDFMNDFMQGDEYFNPSKVMKTDIKENENDYELEIDLPGINKDDVSIELNNGYLQIKATQNNENEENKEEGKYIRKERYYGSYSRSYYVGDNVKEDDIKASYKDGVLDIHVNKVEQLKDESKKVIAIEG